MSGSKVKDVVQQWEIEALLGAHRAANHIAYLLRRRIEAGAAVEAGKWELEIDPFSDLEDEMEDIREGFTAVAGMGINKRVARRKAA
jgi:hypothetical protein